MTGYNFKKSILIGLATLASVVLVSCSSAPTKPAEQAKLAEPAKEAVQKKNEVSLKEMPSPMPNWVLGNACDGLPAPQGQFCFRGQTQLPVESKGMPGGWAVTLAHNNATAVYSSWLESTVGAKFIDKIKGGGESIQGTTAVEIAKQLVKTMTTSSQKGLMPANVYYRSDSVNDAGNRLWLVWQQTYIRKQLVEKNFKEQVAKAKQEAATMNTKIATAKAKALTELEEDFDKDGFFK